VTRNGNSPIGSTAVEGRRRRARRSQVYREEQARIAPYEELARKLIKLRMERDLSQSQLAELIGTSHSAISRLESGQHAPNVETLRKLARAFDRDLVIGFPDVGSAKAREQELVVFAAVS
jgi:DNA-binding XRE family transcriptional regulator